MLQPLVVGLGRSGAGLHVKVLRRLAGSGGPGVWSGPLTGCDPRPGAGHGIPGLEVSATLAEAARRVRDPRHTVVHVCTPPTDRLPLLEELAERGFRRLVVEKPLASGPAALDGLLALRERAGLELAVVAHWLDSRLTARLLRLVREEPYGPLLGIVMDQDKPRFSRSLATSGHPTALEVEIPHSLGLVLRLAGPARLLDARCTDLHAGSEVRAMLGGARVELVHESGVRTTLRSDLASPVRRRTAVLRFRDGTVTAHYPLGEEDDHAQLRLPGTAAPETFADDALSAFLRRTYEDFAAGRDLPHLDLSCAVARLLGEARERCGAVRPAGRGAA